MLQIAYIISMSIAFTYKYDGLLVSYWLKYIMAGVWIFLWMFDIVRKGGKLQDKSYFYLKLYAVPVIIIYLWSLILWCFNRPAGFNEAYFSRASSQVLSLMIALVAPISACYFFKRRAIRLSVYAIALSTLYNVIRAIKVFGIDIFVSFLKSAWIVDFDVTRPTYKISQMLEVHDATLACGFYLIYFLFFYPNENKGRWKHIILLIIAIYIGFKRVAFVGVAVVGIVLFVLKTREEYFKKIVNFITVGIFILAFGYIISIKSGLLELASVILKIDFSGRFIVYDIMSDMISLWPTFLGTGYGYLNKYLGDTTSLASHSDVVRMYVELGFIPYVIWLYYNVKKIPERAYNKYGIEVGRIVLATTIYVFVTYFVGNAMTMFCVEYSLVLIPIALSYSKETELRKHYFKIGNYRF